MRAVAEEDYGRSHVSLFDGDDFLRLWLCHDLIVRGLMELQEDDPVYRRTEPPRAYGSFDFCLPYFPSLEHAREAADAFNAWYAKEPGT